MSETLVHNLAASPWDTAPCVEKISVARGSSQTAKHRTIGRLPGADKQIALPTVQPGQLWLVELPATAPHFSPLEHQALTSANVVIYDRALAPTVARLLPLGGYAEPAVPGERASAWERCLGFARDGWSVVRLVDPRVEPGGLPGRERTHRICRLSERWLGVERLAGFPVLIFANTGCGAYERSEAALDGLINHQSFEQTRTLTLIFRAIDTAAAPRFRVASANGLAG